MADVTVVGGGIGGMVAARRLALAGREVTLLEASDRLGGTVSSHEVGGIRLDAAAESFATRGGIVQKLLGSLGLGDDVVTPDGAGAWLYRLTGDAVPLPATAVLGIPGQPLAADVVRVIGWKAAWRAQLDSLLPSLESRPDVSLGDLVRRRMGSGVLDGLVAPVVHGVHSVHPDDIAADRAAPGLRTATARRGLAEAVRGMRAAAPAGAAAAGIRGGVHRLADALAADLTRFGVDVRLGERVDDPSSLPGRVMVAAPSLLSESGRRIVLATLVLDAPELDAAPRGSGLLVTKGAPGVTARALTHGTAKWSWLREAAAGRHVVRLSYETEPADVLAVARRDAATLLGVELPSSAVVDAARVEWTRAAPASDAPEWALGEAVVGSGVAGIVKHADATVDRMLAEDDAEAAGN